MSFSKVCNYMMFNDGWRSSLKSHTPHTSPSSTHWPKLYKNKNSTGMGRVDAQYDHGNPLKNINKLFAEG